MEPELPPHLHPFVLRVSEVSRRRREQYDVYAPASDASLPAIVFLHGLYPAQLRPTARDWRAAVRTAFRTVVHYLDT